MSSVMSNGENISVIPGQKDIDAQAAEWLLRLEEGDVSASERTAFLAWRGASTRNRDAFDRVCKIWGAFDHAKILADYAVADDTEKLLAEDASRARWGIFGRRSVLTGIAASAAILAVAGLAVNLVDWNGVPRNDLVYTDVGERRSVVLPDSSVIDLNTDSAVEYAYKKNSREISLTRGEVFFEVAPDKQRPFTVETSSGRVVAVGTAFTVKVDQDQVDVLVSEGSVVFLPKDDFAAKTVTPDELARLSGEGTSLTAGQEAVFGAHAEQVDLIGPEMIARKLSWRQGVLAFSGDTLADVVADVSRYTGVDIEIEDEAIRDLPVSGYFKIGGVDEMFEALELMAGLQVEQVSEKRVRLVKVSEET